MLAERPPVEREARGSSPLRTAVGATPGARLACSPSWPWHLTLNQAQGRFESGTGHPADDPARVGHVRGPDRRQSPVSCGWSRDWSVKPAPQRQWWFDSTLTDPASIAQPAESPVLTRAVRGSNPRGGTLRTMAQSGSAPGSGPGGRWFESILSDPSPPVGAAHEHASLSRRRPPVGIRHGRPRGPASAPTRRHGGIGRRTAFRARRAPSWKFESSCRHPCRRSSAWPSTPLVRARSRVRLPPAAPRVSRLPAQARVAQPAERRLRNAQARGSNPLPGSPDPLSLYQSVALRATPTVTFREILGLLPRRA